MNFGVLILSDNKTYGKLKYKKLYKCISKSSIHYLPYEHEIGFSKAHINKYVSFKDNVITHVYGDVNKLENYIEYQLAYYSLNISNNIFTKAINKNNIKNLNIEFDDSYIFSIDPIGSLDIDDAVSIKNDIITIYIANVSIWLDMLNLYEYINRVSTIYLPENKKAMLPNILSDNLCSLRENEVRYAFCMIINNNNISFANRKIKVSKNFRYEEKELLENEHYQKLLQKTNKKDSHELVEHLMILMNYECSKIIKNGIYRTVIGNNEIINNYKGIYVKEPTKHELLQLESYIQITSPIRRLVDLLNMICLQNNLNMNVSQEALQFYDKWYEKLDYINDTMRKIKKVQNECNLLYLIQNDATILEKEYDGIKIDDNHVYIKGLKFIGKSNQGNGKYKIYLFTDEYNLKRKIRLEKM